jgi:hypothetical protein
MQEGDFQAVISTLNVVDHDGDLTLPGAFGEQQVIISSYGHASWGGGFNGLPVGKGRIFEAGNEAIAEGRFFLDTRGGQETYRAVKDLGELQEWSYALPWTEHEYSTIDGRRVRILKRIKVPEVSPVLMGAGIRTRTLSIKAAGGEVKLFSGPIILGGEESPAALFRQFKSIVVGYDRNAGGLDSATMAEVRRVEREVRERQVYLAQLAERTRYWYAEVTPEKTTDSAVVKGAEAGVEYLRRKLGVPWPVRLRWFTEQSWQERERLKELGILDWFESCSFEGPVNGWARHFSGEIWVKAGRELWSTLCTIAHELVHTRQAPGHDEQADEAEASQLAASAITELRAILA